MSAPTMLGSISEAIRAMFPALSRIRIRPQTEGGALAVGSASGKVEIAGGGPAVARKDDLVVRLAFWPGTPAPAYTPPSLWASASTASPYAWTQIATLITPTPSPYDHGTPITMATGSEKVTCA